MQNWSKQTKQYLQIAGAVFAISILAFTALYLTSRGGYALPEVLYVVDKQGVVHAPQSPKSRQAIHNLREAGLDTLKKEYPALVLLNDPKAVEKGHPLLLMSNDRDDLQDLIDQRQ